MGARARASISGAPSWGWLRAAFRSAAAAFTPSRLARGDDCRCCCSAPSSDRLVSAGRDRAGGAAAAACRARDLPGRRARNPARGRSDPARARWPGSTPSSTRDAQMSATISRSSARAWPARASPPSLAGAAQVLLLEAESQPGYHATGRSAAFWSESYGGPLIQPLTSASRAAPRRRRLPQPARRDPSRRRGGERGARRAARRNSPAPCALEPLDRAALEARDSRAQAGLGPGPRRAELRRHRRRRPARCLSRRGARERRAARHRRSPAAGAARDGGRWRIETRAGRVRGGHPGRCRRRLGRRCRRAARRARRSASSPIAAPSPSCASIRRRRPTCRLIIDAARPLLLQARGGRAALAQPARRDPVATRATARPRRSTSRIAIDRLEQVVDWRVEAVERKWAGLQQLRAGPAAGLRLQRRRPRLLLVRRAGRLRHPDRARRGGAGRRPAARRRAPAHRSRALFAPCASRS